MSQYIIDLREVVSVPPGTTTVSGLDSALNAAEDRLQELILQAMIARCQVRQAREGRTIANLPAGLVRRKPDAPRKFRSAAKVQDREINLGG